MDKLRVAVVGCGLVAQNRHIPGFLRLKKNVSICAVCDTNQNIARNVAGKFNIRHPYADLQELLSREKPDIVDVCTPPQTHLSIATESMASGSHVLLEKPMAFSVRDCDKMISASQEHGVKFCIVHNQKFYPPFLKAQELVENGAIGKLINMRILFSVPRDQYVGQENHWVHRLPGGAIGECGPHAVYLALSFLRKIKDVDVHATKTTVHPWVSFDDYDIVLEGENLQCHIINTYSGDYSAFDIDLIGTKGMIKVDLQRMLLAFFRGQRLEPMSHNIHSSGVLLAFSSLNAAGQILKGVASNAFATMLGKTFVSHYILIREFVNSIVNDQEVPVPPEEGRETTRVMEEIVKRLNQENGLTSLNGNWIESQRH